MATRSVDLVAVLIAVIFIVTGAIVATPAAPYFNVFIGAFIGALLLLTITDCIAHPTSWCPSPMYIDGQGICRQS